MYQLLSKGAFICYVFEVWLLTKRQANIIKSKQGNMDDLCYRTKAIVQKVQHDLHSLEQSIRLPRSFDTIEADLLRQEHQISLNVDLALSNCERLNVLARNEPPFNRKQIELAVSQIRSECQYLRNNLQLIQRKRASMEQESHFRANLFAPPVGSSGSGVTVVHIDSEINELSRLQAVGRRLDEMLLGGSASLEALKYQGSTLKNSHRRLMDLASTLGLSNTVMRLIQRRSYQDKVLFYALAIGTVISIILNLPNMKESNVYTINEVNKHNTEGDCWVVINDKVYDVTSLLGKHPGGTDSIMEVAGTYATKSFNAVPHSEGACHWMNKFHIGEIAEKDSEFHPKFVNNCFKKKLAELKFMDFAVPTGVLLTAVYAMGRYIRRR
nr:Golgi SNAP receptor complex [Hymenolepis microstoma]